MEWTAARIVGHNVKKTRERLGMTGAVLGAKMGAIFREDGKPWPRQTVSLLEGGDRVMVAAEVVALAEVLDVRVADLYAPPAGVEEVQAGTRCVSVERLAAPVGGDPHIEALGEALKASELARVRIEALARAQRVIVADALAALRGDGPAPRPAGDRVADALQRVAVDAADDLYAEAAAARDSLPDLADVLDRPHGEDEDGDR
ncbi:helix-turn-helix transcriptional regulator [Micrococcus endophyticus]